MTEEISKMNIFQRLASIRKIVDVIQKNKSGFNYKYVTEDEILAKVKAGMDKYRVFLYPNFKPDTTTVTPHSYTKVKFTKSGDRIEEVINEVIVNAEMTFTWVNIDNPEETLPVDWIVVGEQGDASQAVGSGLSYMHRYFLLKFFQIATPEADPDNWRSKKQEAENEEDKEIVAEIINQIDVAISEFLKTVGDEKMDATKKSLFEIIKKHVKKNGKPSADYRVIVDAKTASAVLREINEFMEAAK